MNIIKLSLFAAALSLIIVIIAVRAWPKLPAEIDAQIGVYKWIVDKTFVEPTTLTVSSPGITVIKNCEWPANGKQPYVRLEQGELRMIGCSFKADVNIIRTTNDVIIIAPTVFEEVIEVQVDESTRKLKLEQ